MVSLFMPMLYFAFFTFALVALTKKSFGKCLPIALLTAPMLLFLSQICFGTFNVGFFIGIIGAISAVPLAIWRIRRNGWQWTKEHFFSTGFIVFLVIMVLVFIYDLKRGFSAWDEYSHWGMMLKEMLRLDKFYFVDASNLMVHKDYPPMLQLFELFWLKLCGGGYSEIYAERAVHVFSLALILPMVLDYWTAKKEMLKKIGVGVLACLIVALTVLLFDQHGVIQTIYNDYPMAIVVVCLLLVVLLAKKIGWFEIVELALCGSFLLLLKQMGLPLYLMVLCFLLGVVAIRNGGVKKMFTGRSPWKIAIAVVVLLLPFAGWFVWSKMTAGVPHQFDLASLNIMDFIKMLMGRGGEEWQKYTIMQYTDALGQRSISTSYIQISFLQSVVIYIAGIVYYCRVAKKEASKKEIVWFLLVTVVGAFGYAMSMLLLYVMAFGSYEGPILASFERYMGTYSIIMFLIVLLMFVWLCIRRKKYATIGWIAVGAVVLTAPAAYARLYPSLTSKNPHAEYVALASEISDAVDGDGEDNESVFVISQSKVGFHYYLQYELNDYHLNNTNYVWDTSDAALAATNYEKNILPSLLKYDYLYVADLDERFQEQYCKLIGQCPVLQNSIYKIKKDGAGIKLELIKQIGESQ